MTDPDPPRPPAAMVAAATADPARPAPLSAHVAVVGAGFAGLEVARELGRRGITVTLIDRQNHHLFQPLLYQVATAALSGADIAEPIRSLLRRHESVRVLFDEVRRVDPAAKTLHLGTGASVPYDYLVLAAGAGPSYFGHPEWQQAAPGLKTIEDAVRIRSRLLMAFEEAERCDDPEERARLMTIAVIGGGPTGIELTGAIAELSHATLARDFWHIRPEATRVLLIEGGPRLLPGFREDMARYAQTRLEGLGVKVMTDTKVEALTPTELRFGDTALPVGLVIWAAGVAASPLAGTLGCALEEGGRIAVLPTLEVPDHPGVFALGDIAHCPDAEGQPLPGLAQVAKQQGRHLGRSLGAHIADGTPLSPFAYRSRGQTAIVGRHRAIYQTARFAVTGWVAWLSWALVHIYLLVGLQNRLVVSARWLTRYLTDRRGARLISRTAAGEAPESGGAPSRPPSARPSA